LKAKPTASAGGPTTAPKPTGPKWTDEQHRAIHTTGKSLLVSAAAGSGKTAVLAERCAYLVCEATEPCDVDELLVVTFTEAAAAEMKARIQKSIREHVSTDPNPRLQRQLALIDRAQVSTLHGFCAKLIRQHFHLLGLDPAFAVMDGDEASLLRTEIARQLFADRYESDADGTFQAFVDAYGDGNDERLIHQVIGTHELLQSLIDPTAWIARAKERIDRACEGELSKCELGEELLAHVKGRLEDVLQRCRDAYRTLSTQTAFAKYTEQLKDLGLALRHWQEVLESEGLDALCEAVTDLQLPKLPPMSNAVPGKEAAKALIDAVRDDLKDGKLRAILRFNCAQWTDGMKSMCASARVFLSLVEEFGQRYRREKDSARAVDFSDLERMALDALRDRNAPGLVPSAVARLLHKQFKHVLVDEYQDINEVQDAILSLASTECLQSGETPKNLFTVGDVKQSIYRFRLAEPHRFLERHARFRNGDESLGEVIDLQANFRSRGPLLEALNQIFQRLMTKAAADIEYDASHRLNEGLKYPTAGDGTFAGSPIELHLLPHDAAAPAPEEDQPAASAIDEEELDRTEREALLIAQRIIRITGRDGSMPMHVMEKQPDGSLAPRPAKLSDIVILLRSMRYKADQFADVLRASGIPVHSESGTGYFESMEVRDVLALLKVLDNRQQDVPLAAFLRSPIASLPDAEDSLARIRLAYPSHATRMSFHEAVSHYADERDDELAARLKDLLTQLDRWREMAQRRPLAELLWDIYDSTGYLAFCTGLADGEQRVANLIDLHERARQFGSFHRQGLARFLSFLDSLQSESDLGQPSIVSGAEDVVRVMSIHRSKGLEFPIVILPDLGKAINLSDCSGSILVDRHAYLGLSAVDEQKQIRYPSLASTLVEARLRQQSLAEELRVLYVALTRAKEHLILIGTCSDTKCESWQARFAGHAGAFSADTVLSARAMLDWIGPVSAAAPTIFEVRRHTPEEMANWPSPQAMRPGETERQQKLARLEPLAPAPPSDATADAVLNRLSWKYPYGRYSKVPAVQAVSAIAKESRKAYPAAAPAKFEIQEFVKPLELPRALKLDRKPDAGEIGSAAHLLLQHLDFTRPCDAADLRRQLDNLLDRRLISKPAANAVDLDSICWLASSRIGDLIRAHYTDIRRELSITFATEAADAAIAAPTDDPKDRTMIRSRLDVMIPTPRGMEIVDYKTDRVTKETLNDRIEFYRPQMAFYRQALLNLTGEVPVAIHLVFLHLREIITVEHAAGATAPA
jgi:ATP-dependent helicase/nuclease subunit A